jgi:tetratricopeptide (TPR) repeat protein
MASVPTLEAPSTDTYQSAVSLYSSGRLREALATLEPLIESSSVDEDTHQAEALNLAAACSLGLNQKSDAESYWRRAIQVKSDYAQVHYNLGVLLHGLNRLPEAELACRRALALRADYAPAHNNLSIVLKELDRLPEAEAACRQALAICADDAAVHHNLGTILVELGRLPDAEASFRKALALQPDHVDAKCKLGALLLSTGRFEEGWQLYEARYDERLTDRHAFAPSVRYPQWRGEGLQGKSVLVWQEQGYGDMIQFGRYLSVLKAQGAAWITLACAPALHRLFGALADVDAVVDGESELARAEHDFWTLPLSIPHRVGTTLESIPFAVYLKPSGELVEKWRARFGPAKKARIGLVWKGNPAHGNDRHRSLPSLATLAPLLSVPGVSFVSLQKGQGETDVQSLEPGQSMVHAGPDIQDFADTAAIIAQLDLVICVDTAVAHLAGGLGKPCWVLLPERATDWRWMQERVDSPWYPGTTRLFRQAARGDWTATIEQVRRACLDVFAA